MSNFIMFELDLDEVKIAVKVLGELSGVCTKALNHTIELYANGECSAEQLLHNAEILSHDKKIYQQAVTSLTNFILNNGGQEIDED